MVGQEGWCGLATAGPGRAESSKAGGGVWRRAWGLGRGSTKYGDGVSDDWVRNGMELHGGGALGSAWRAVARLGEVWCWSVGRLGAKSGGAAWWWCLAECMGQAVTRVVGCRTVRCEMGWTGMVLVLGGEHRGCDAGRRVPGRSESDGWVRNGVGRHSGGAWRSAGDGLAVAKSCGLARGAGMHGVESSEERDLFGSGAELRQFGGGFWSSGRYIG